jgi:hypothetical protein
MARDGQKEGAETKVQSHEDPDGSQLLARCFLGLITAQHLLGYGWREQSWSLSLTRRGYGRSRGKGGSEA